MEIAFHGKRALVTGAGKGIGRDLAKRLHKYGAEVVAFDWVESLLQTLKEECPSIEIVTVDLGDWDATKQAVERIGPVDLLVNNAAISILTSFGDVTEEEFDKTMNINLKGPLNISQIVVKGMKERGTGGSIVNVSTVGSKIVCLPGIAVYGPLKAALNHLSRIMAVELGPHKIRVNSVLPTLVRTEMATPVMENKKLYDKFLGKIPIGRICETAEVVDTIIYLLSDKASMVNGADILVDGGNIACG